MSYKIILVHVDDSKNVDARIEIAAQLAITEDAHLIGAAMTGASRFFYDPMPVDLGVLNIKPYLDILRQKTEETLKKFENIVQRVGVKSFEKRLTDDEAAGGLSLQASYCDLIVLGQYDPEGTSSPVYADLPEYVVMNSVSPALIVPSEGSFDNISDRVLIAWNGSMEATRAVRHAIPLLRRAKTVEVVIFNPSSKLDKYDELSGADIALYLARHNIKVDVMQEKTDSDIGDALLSLAANLNSRLLVMGCYGHSRFREILLGGATRTVLQYMTIPVLMAH
jgi:nucleotide-binding universal stress UspA family protein